MRDFLESIFSRIRIKVSMHKLKIIITLVGDVYKFPPVLSLINALKCLEIDTVFVSTTPSGNISLLNNNMIFEDINIEYEKIKSPIKKLILMPNISRKIWNSIDKYYDNNSLIWVVSDVTIKYLGNKLLVKNYILHLMELSQQLLFYKQLVFFKLNEKKIGNGAKAIIVPEYNRAHITSAWWQLSNLPFVLPNKPHYDVNINKNSTIDNKKAEEIINKIGNKKIILYQGILDEERPLEQLIYAVDEMGEDYAFVVMSGGKNIYENIKSNNYFFIPFVKPPEHLQITSHAYIGVLSYVPTTSTSYSELNSIYCAPNKTFEFSMFGIPMIGNNIPGLSYLFETKNIGRCFDSFNISDIVSAIKLVESEYSILSQNALNYYNETNYVEIVKSIVEKIVK